MTLPFFSKVREALFRLGIRPGGLVVAVSGGPDSMTLLLALLALRASDLLSESDAPANTFVVAHLNHQLRGVASDADARFVDEELPGLLSAKGVKNVQFRCECIDVCAQARATHGNLESVARRIRYEWLLRVARESKLHFVATGHTANDQAETVLHRIVRGTGLRGLRGIPLRRPMGTDVEVIRPLLSVTRSEALAYLEAERQPFRQDSSNTDLRFTRNRIRHQLIPHLAKRYNSDIVTALCRLAEQATEAYRRQQKFAEQTLQEAEYPRAEALLVFDQQRLAAAPRHLIREVFRLAWSREGWPSGGMGFREWDRLAAVALGEIKAVDLPGRIRARLHGRVVQVGPLP
jgi:tRNA(Ile)-lysidine synthase